MKKILVAIDFSDCSINAFEHAISIANKANAALELLWVNKPEGTQDVFTEGPETLASLVNDRFEELLEKYKPQLETGILTYTTREGKIYKEIAKASEAEDVFMVVAGTHGSSGFEEFWIGSNANRMVTYVNKPVLTIRGGIDIDRDLKKIVLPIDSTVETRQKVPFTAYLASLFDAEMHIVSIYSSKVKSIMTRVDKYSEQVVKHLEEENVRFHLESMHVDNLTDSTIEYAISVDANLISIMTEQERRAKNLWLGPYAQQMVNHSPIPVLSTDPRAGMIALAR